MSVTIGPTPEQAEMFWSYGVLIDNRVSSPLLTRVGNPLLHTTLPVQSNLKGCLLSDTGVVNYYLSATDDNYKEDEITASVLDGTDGQVMVEIPAYYFKVITIDTYQTEIRISPLRLLGYTLVPKRYISKYKASLQRSTSKLSSVLNTSTDYRGGNNSATNDANSKTFLGKPATSISLTNFRTYARNRYTGTHWNCSTYESHKSLYWLFVIEYANLNSQAAVTVIDGNTGLMRGGLGNGVTTANGTEWNNFNGYNPMCPIGVTAPLGNSSGEVNFTVADFGGSGVNRTFNANRYRGIENPFGDIWEWTDGILINNATNSELYTSNTPANFNDSTLANYINRGVLIRNDGWIKTTLLGTNGDILPTTVGGDYNIYYSDYYYQTVSLGVFGVVFGGAAHYGASAGLVFAATLNAPSYATMNIGSRLCFE